MIQEGSLLQRLNSENLLCADVGASGAVSWCAWRNDEVDGLVEKPIENLQKTTVLTCFDMFLALNQSVNGLA